MYTLPIPISSKRRPLREFLESQGHKPVVKPVRMPESPKSWPFWPVYPKAQRIAKAPKLKSVITPVTACMRLA